MNLYKLHNNPNKLLYYDTLQKYTDVIPMLTLILNFKDNDGTEDELFDELPSVIENYPEFTRVIEKILLYVAVESEDPELLVFYASEVIMKRWPEAEYYIYQDPYWEERYKEELTELGAEF